MGLCISLLSTIDLNDAILIDILEDMWRIHENANGPGSGDNEEDI